jgi:hypothetical protein
VPAAGVWTYLRHAVTQMEMTLVEGDTNASEPVWLRCIVQRVLVVKYVHLSDCEVKGQDS